jgi:hypothetical protein
MGSAYYYLKAEFPKPLTEEEVTGITDFFYEGVKAEKWYHENRGRDPAYFWSELEKAFPGRLSIFMRDAGLWGKDTKNGIAGHIDFGGSEECVDDGLHLAAGDVTLMYTVEVWHFADWDNIANYIRKYFGAIDVRWMSDESTDYFLLLSAEENEEIIKNLLSQKDTLPTLMGIHPALDRRISQKLL